MTKRRINYKYTRAKSIFSTKNRHMVALKMDDRKRWAQDLVCKQGLTQREAAETVGVTAVTMNKWYKLGNWEALKQSMLTTRTAQLDRLYMQLDELNALIMQREAGKRFADPKEANTITQLTTSIKKLETEASISDIVEVAKRLGDWMRSQNHPNTLAVVNICNDFIKDLLKR